MPSAKSSRQPVRAFTAKGVSFIERICVQARTTPASELRSVIPIAAIPSMPAAETSSQGCEAPRRNEKLVAV